MAANHRVADSPPLSRRTFSLRTRLLLGTLLVLMPAFGLLLYGFQRYYTQERVRVLTELTQTAEALAALVAYERGVS